MCTVKSISVLVLRSMRRTLLCTGVHSIGRAHSGQRQDDVCEVQLWCVTLLWRLMLYSNQTTQCASMGPTSTGGLFVSTHPRSICLQSLTKSLASS